MLDNYALDKIVKLHKYRKITKLFDNKDLQNLQVRKKELRLINLQLAL